MCLYWRLLMNNSSFYLFIYFDDSWSCEPLSLKHQWFRRNMCSILWKTAREVLFFCCCGFRWRNRWYSEWRVHSLVWRCHIWKTNGSGKKPLALFVLMLCVNIPPRRLKMKFVVLFGLWSVVQCWEICDSYSKRVLFSCWMNMKPSKAPSRTCLSVLFFLFSCRLISIRIIIWTCLQRLLWRLYQRKSDFTNLLLIRWNCSRFSPFFPSLCV